MTITAEQAQLVDGGGPASAPTQQPAAVGGLSGAVRPCSTHAASPIVSTGRPSRLSATLSPPQQPQAPTPPLLVLPACAVVAHSPPQLPSPKATCAAAMVETTKNIPTVPPSLAAAAAAAAAARAPPSQLRPEAAAAAAAAACMDAHPGAGVRSTASDDEPSNDTCAQRASISDTESGSLPWWFDVRAPWFRQPGKLAAAALLALSGGLMLAGILLQQLLAPKAHADLQSGLTQDEPTRVQEAYPWLYFFSALAPLAFTLRWLCWRLYRAAEFTPLSEWLYFLRPLRSKAAALLFWLAVLLWYRACFAWLPWCDNRRGCAWPSRHGALTTVWRVLVCCTLFCTAAFLKCAIARLLSYGAYKTAHFAKVRDAIERELYLVRLSKARRTLLPAPPPASPVRPSAGGAAASSQGGTQGDGPGAATAGSSVWANVRGSMLWRRGSMLIPGTSGGGVSAPHACAAAPGLVKDTADHAQVQCRLSEEGDASSPSSSVSDGGTVLVQVGAKPSGSCSARPVSGSSHLQGAPPRSLDPGDSGVCCSGSSCNPDRHQTSTTRFERESADSPLLQPTARATSHPLWAAHDAQRPPSFEQFMASRVPSLLGPAAAGPGSCVRGGSHSSRAAAIAARAARAASGVHNGDGSCGRVSSGRATGGGGGGASRVLLPGMVPGVDGLLLAPAVLGEVTAAAREQRSTDGGGPPRCVMSQDDLEVMRRALGINSYANFVDRYLGMSPSEEAEHVRHVRRFARALFFNILGDADRDHLLPSDFVMFFGPGNEATARDAFDYFDRNNDGSISCSELMESAAEMLCERKNIATSIKDTDSVVDSLETGLGLLIHVVFVVFYLLVFGVNIVQGWGTFASAVLAMAFIFGDSVKGVFESALYLFVERPYDVGDLLSLPPTGALARVKKIDLMYTQLTRGTGEHVLFPNATMRSLQLVNISRSAPKSEGFSWLLDYDVPDELFGAVADAVRAHVASAPSHFRGEPLVFWKACEEPLKLRLQVSVTYSFTGEDVRRHLNVRTALLNVVRHELRAAGARYTVPSSASGVPAAFALPGAGV